MLLPFNVLGFWPWGLWVLSCSTRGGTRTLCIRRQSLNHWTAREVPVHSSSVIFILSRPFPQSPHSHAPSSPPLSLFLVAVLTVFSSWLACARFCRNVRSSHLFKRQNCKLCTHVMTKAETSPRPGSSGAGSGGMMPLLLEKPWWHSTFEVPPRVHCVLPSRLRRGGFSVWHLLVTHEHL